MRAGVLEVAHEGRGRSIFARETTHAEPAMARDDLQEPVEVGIVVHEAHRKGAPSAAFTSACVRREP
jgi:hypothetical protein